MTSQPRGAQIAAQKRKDAQRKIREENRQSKYQKAKELLESSLMAHFHIWYGSPALSGLIECNF